MSAKQFLWLLALTSSLAAAPQLEWQELQIQQRACEEQLRHQKNELTLLYEKVEGLRIALEGSSGGKAPSSSFEKRLAALENRLQLLDQQLTGELKTLHRTLESMVALLQKGEGLSAKSYIVKSGDSLGKIALDHKTTIKQLKELNHLTNDQIVVGQKLEIP